jgi:selenocysteine lyase/cysteine desulfurase
MKKKRVSVCSCNPILAKRVSTHFYNTTAEIDHMIEALKAMYAEA